MEVLDSYDRDSILAKFQAVSNIDEFETCISILEANDWDLQKALLSVFYEDDIATQQIKIEENDKAGRYDKSEVVYLDPDENKISELKFIVYYDNNICTINISEQETVGSLKRLLHTQCGFQCHTMSLEGLLEGHDDASDSMVLSSLNLCKETKLFLHKKTGSPGEKYKHKMPLKSIPLIDLEVQERIADISLNVQHNLKEYKLRFNAAQTIQDVKEKLFILSNVLPKHQTWIGWPLGSTEKTQLGNLELKQPYSLYMTELDAPILPDSLASSSASVNNLDFEGHIISDDDELFEVDPKYCQKLSPLLPHNSDDNSQTMVVFQQRFEERYHDFHPDFYLGSLQDAMSEAEGKNIIERKPLLIYLHHDGSIFANIFCSQMLCSKEFVSFVNENFVFWGWDMTYESNKIRFVNMLVQHFGNLSVPMVTKYDDSDYPLLVVVSKSKSAAEICLVLQANTSLDEVMSAVMTAYETAQQSQDIELRIENDRLARDAEKQEQDAAFYASLTADKAKVAAEHARFLLEQEKYKEAQLQEVERLSCLEKLPAEPAEGEPNVTNIIFRFPGGERESRRFHANELLQVMFMYLSSKGFNKTNHRFVTNFPKREFTKEDANRTFEDMKLVPRTSVFVEEL